MEKKTPTIAQLRKQLRLGDEVILPSGENGVFLYFCKYAKTSAWVLRGRLEDQGGKITVPVEAMIRKTFDVT